MPQAMARQEHYLAHRLKLSARMTVMDAGYRFSGPATEIAKFVGCKVVGLNINAYQLQKAAEIAKAKGVSEYVLELRLGDFLVSA
jgi:sterol 24-C-methyltransferase